MKKLKQKLIQFLVSNFTGKVRPAKNGNGIIVFADISADLAKIEHMAKACELTVFTSKRTFSPKTGEEIPARAWIGASTSKDISEEDLLSQI